MSAPLTPEQLAELERTNPVAASRYKLAHGVHTNVAAPAPEAPPTTESAEQRTHRELRKVNPVLAARYALAHGLFNK